MRHPFLPPASPMYLQFYRCPKCDLYEGHNRCRAKPPTVAAPTCCRCWHDRRECVKMVPEDMGQLVEGMKETRGVSWMCLTCRTVNVVWGSTEMVCKKCRAVRHLKDKN